MLGTRAAHTVALLLVAPALAGCLGGDTPGSQEELAPLSSEPAEQATNPRDPWNGTDQLRVVDHEHDMTGGFEADVLCLTGGGPQIPRTGAPVASGTGHLEITVSVDPGWPGIQVGYVVDGSDAAYAGGEEEPITWLPTVYPGMTETFEVEVVADQVEADEARWSFYYQVNPGAEELCYTGAGTGTWSVTVDAVRSLA